MRKGEPRYLPIGVGVDFISSHLSNIIVRVSNVVDMDPVSTCVRVCICECTGETTDRM